MHGRETGKWSGYPVSYQLTPWLAAVKWTSTPTELHGLVLFTERQNLVSTCVPSHCNCSITSEVISSLILFQNIFWQLLTYLPWTLSCKATQSNRVTKTHCIISHIILNCKTNTLKFKKLSSNWSVCSLCHPQNQKQATKWITVYQCKTVCIPISGLQQHFLLVSMSWCKSGGR
jgi:hypothetical protein